MISLTTTLSASPADVYTAWLSSQGHSAMTGSTATASDRVDALFTAWDGYISGSNTELVPNKKIVQAWRTSEFPDDALDSTLTIELVPTHSGTELRLTHKNTPKDQEANYRKGWQEHYFEPMQRYFSK